MIGTINTNTPVLLLGGRENALSVARTLGSKGIAVTISSRASCWGMYSRYCRRAVPIPKGQMPLEFWSKMLLGDDSAYDGHIVFACNDDALEFVASKRDELAQRYILPEIEPHLIHAMLDKQQSLEMARKIGVPTPDSWMIEKIEDVAALKGSLTFPVMVKPIHSHKFMRVFNRKLFIIENDFEELREKVGLALGKNLQVTVVEMIPGPDTLLHSYYTYIDRNGRCLYHYTKRVVRRFPTNRGGGCAHLCGWNPEVAALGRRFFEDIGFRGIANIEFKRDTRDGQFKLIEVNARFTAAHELNVRAGMPFDLIVYCHLTGQPLLKIESFKKDLGLWYPLKDFWAFRELNQRGELSFVQWVKSILAYRQIFPVFALRDPWPFVVSTVALLRRAKEAA